MNDINMLAITLLVWALGAAETAIGLSLLILLSCTKKNEQHNKYHNLCNMNNIRCISGILLFNLLYSNNY